MVCFPPTTLLYTSKRRPSPAWVLIDSYRHKVPLPPPPTGAARTPQALRRPRHLLPGTCSRTSSICYHLSFKTSPPSCTTRPCSPQPSPNLNPSRSQTRLRKEPCPDRTASSSTTSGPRLLSRSSPPRLLTLSSTISAVEEQATSRSPPTTGMLAFPAARWVTRALPPTTSLPLALNNIDPSFSLPTPHLPLLLLPLLERVQKVVQVVVILQEVLRRHQGLLIRPPRLPQPRPPRPLLLQRQELILQTRFQRLAPALLHLDSSRPLNLLRLPLLLSSSLPPPPLQLPNLSPSPACLVTAPQCPL